MKQIQIQRHVPRRPGPEPVRSEYHDPVLRAARRAEERTVRRARRGAR